MAGKFEIKYFSQIDLADPFFDTLKKTIRNSLNIGSPNVSKKDVEHGSLVTKRVLLHLLHLKKKMSRFPLKEPLCLHVRV